MTRITDPITGFQYSADATTVDKVMFVAMHLSAMAKDTENHDLNDVADALHSYLDDLVSLSTNTQKVLERIRALELEYSDVTSLDDTEENLPRWEEYISRRSVVEGALYNAMLMNFDLDEPAQD